jgi:hypothetical protein
MIAVSKVRIGGSVILFIISISAAQAKVSDRLMRNLTNALKQAAVTAAQYEKCGINSEPLKNVILDGLEVITHPLFRRGNQDENRD